MMSKPEKIGTLKNIHYQDFDFPQKTEEECSLINARIRQKLNHKKMISMYRYGWLICFFFKFKRYNYNPHLKCYKCPSIQAAQIRSKNSEKLTIRRQTERFKSSKREMIYTLIRKFDSAWKHRQHGSPPRPRNNLLLAPCGCFCSFTQETFQRLSMLKKLSSSIKKESILQTRKKLPIISLGK